MIRLAGIGHVLLRVADVEASKRFYQGVLGFAVAEQDPEHGGVFMTLGDGFHTIDITQHATPHEASRPERGGLGLVHIAFKVASYAALREAYAHLLQNGVAIQRATDHVCQRSLYFTDPDGNGLEIYYEMPRALELFPNGRGDEDEALPLSGAGDPLPAWLTEDWPGSAAMAKVERLRQGTEPSAAV
jgi:catechol 2,3-dioxygenase